MQAVGRACAVVLAVVFVWAAVSKLRNRRGTATAFAAMGLPGARTLSGVVPALELVLAVVLIVSPALGGAVALALLAAFSALLARNLGASGCACFGAASTRQVAATDLVRNACLSFLAAVAVLTTIL